MKVLNLPKKLLSRGSDPGNQRSKTYFYTFKLKSKYQAGTQNFFVRATHSFTLLPFPTKINFWIREIRNHGITVKYYSSTCDVSLHFFIKNFAGPPWRISQQ